MKLAAFQFSVASLLLAGLTGCGGGGSSSPTGPVVSTLSFPLLSGYQTLVAKGWSKTFAISGTCSGSIAMTRTPANLGISFEGRPALAASETITMAFSNCTPSSSATTATVYYDMNFYPLGLDSVGVNYGVYLTAPVIPTTVTVGSTAIVGTETLYTDSTKTVPNGRVDSSYVIEADTATTAIANLIAKGYNSSGVLQYTEQDRYRMNSTGALTPISLDIQYASGTHLVGQ